MTDYTIRAYSYADVGLNDPRPAFDPNQAGGSTLPGKSFTYDSSKMSPMSLTFRDDDGIMQDNGGTANASGQTYDSSEYMVNFNGNTSSTYTGSGNVDWNAFAKYTMTGSDGSSFQVYLIARSNPASGGRTSLKADGTATDNTSAYYFVFTQPLKNGVTYTYGTWSAYADMPYASALVCFARGTLIETDRGAVAIEDLAKGDLVMTRDNGLQPIRWVGSRVLSSDELALNERLRPIRIRAGALGHGLPITDLLVSPQHRVLVRSHIAQKMFGAPEVLVAAKQLCQIDGIDIAYDIASVEYFHMLFDRHEVVISNGAETESLFTGPEALKALGPASAEEIFAIFPELRDRDHAPSSARLMASGRLARKLAVRHANRSKPLVM